MKKKPLHQFNDDISPWHQDDHTNNLAPHAFPRLNNPTKKKSLPRPILIKRRKAPHISERDKENNKLLEAPLQPFTQEVSAKPLEQFYQDQQDNKIPKLPRLRIRSNLNFVNGEQFERLVQKMERDAVASTPLTNRFSNSKRMSIKKTRLDVLLNWAFHH